MAAILLFPIDKEEITMKDLSEAMNSAFGFNCFPFQGGKKLAAADLLDGGILREGQLWLNLPEWEEAEGDPIVSYEISPRLDRDEALQEMVDEIIKQDENLKEPLDHNSFDVVLTFDDTLAGVEAAHCLSYVISAGTGGGLLVPDDEEETLWFDTAEDFAEAVFYDEDDDEDGEDGDEEE